MGDIFSFVSIYVSQNSVNKKVEPLYIGTKNDVTSQLFIKIDIYYICIEYAAKSILIYSFRKTEYFYVYNKNY